MSLPQHTVRCKSRMPVYLAAAAVAGPRIVVLTIIILRSEDWRQFADVIVIVISSLRALSFLEPRTLNLRSCHQAITSSSSAPARVSAANNSNQFGCHLVIYDCKDIIQWARGWARGGYYYTLTMNREYRRIFISMNCKELLWILHV